MDIEKKKLEWEKQKAVMQFGERVLTTGKDMTLAAMSNPLLQLVLAALLIQGLYNAGAFNPRDPQNPGGPRMWSEGSKIATGLGQIVVNVEVMKALASVTVTPLLQAVGGIAGALK